MTNQNPPGTDILPLLEGEGPKSILQDQLHHSKMKQLRKRSIILRGVKKSWVGEKTRVVRNGMHPHWKIDEQIFTRAKSAGVKKWVKCIYSWGARFWGRCRHSFEPFHELSSRGEGFSPEEAKWSWWWRGGDQRGYFLQEKGYYLLSCQGFPLDSVLLTLSGRGEKKSHRLWLWVYEWEGGGGRKNRRKSFDVFSPGKECRARTSLRGLLFRLWKSFYIFLVLVISYRYKQRLARARYRTRRRRVLMCVVWAGDWKHLCW